MLNPVDLLICEMAHLGPDDLIRVLTGKTVSTLCIVHMGSEARELGGELMTKLVLALPDLRDIYIPSDGESIDFP